MTKQDILEMKTLKEIMPTLKTHPELWDKEVNEHLIAISKKETLEEYGDENFIPYLPAIPKTEKH